MADLMGNPFFMSQVCFLSFTPLIMIIVVGRGCWESCLGAVFTQQVHYLLQIYVELTIQQRERGELEASAPMEWEIGM